MSSNLKHDLGSDDCNGQSIRLAEDRSMQDESLKMHKVQIACKRRGWEYYSVVVETS
jgi:hypothetical protein